MITVAIDLRKMKVQGSPDFEYEVTFFQRKQINPLGGTPVKGHGLTIGRNSGDLYDLEIDRVIHNWTTGDITVWLETLTFFETQELEEMGRELTDNGFEKGHP